MKYAAIKFNVARISITKLPLIPWANTFTISDVDCKIAEVIHDNNMIVTYALRAGSILQIQQFNFEIAKKYNLLIQ